MKNRVLLLAGFIIISLVFSTQLSTFVAAVAEDTQVHPVLQPILNYAFPNTQSLDIVDVVSEATSSGITIISMTDQNDPRAAAGSDINWGLSPLTVSFSSFGSYDPQGKELNYLWDFGDSTSTTSAYPIKTYTKEGKYVASLRVSNGEATSSAVSLDIQVGNPPMIQIEQPYNGALFSAEETIPYTIHTDESTVTTELILHSVTTATSAAEPVKGLTGIFTLPKEKHVSTNIYYEIKATAVDANSLSATTSVFLYPRKSSITLLSNPFGIPVSVDGKIVSTPYTFETIANTPHEISTEARHTIRGTTYDFSKWNDSNQRTIKINAPDIYSTMSAEFVQTKEDLYQGEYFNNPTLNGEPVLRKVSEAIDFTWKNSSPDPVIFADNFSARWTKTYEATSSGIYRFSATADDGARLIIDGKTIIDKWVNQTAATYAADVTLTQGNHTVVMEYFDSHEDAVAKLTIDRIKHISDVPEENDVSNMEGGFIAEYFPNPDLSGVSIVRQTLSKIDVKWNESSPDPRIPVDNYSARYTKNEYFEGGIYRFIVTADDGVRVSIDNQVILDQWKDQSSTMYTFFPTIQSGLHTIVVEYFENSGSAGISVGYERMEE